MKKGLWILALLIAVITTTVTFTGCEEKFELTHDITAKVESVAFCDDINHMIIEGFSSVKKFGNDPWDGTLEYFDGSVPDFIAPFFTANPYTEQSSYDGTVNGTGTGTGSLKNVSALGLGAVLLSLEIPDFMPESWMLGYMVKASLPSTSTEEGVLQCHAYIELDGILYQINTGDMETSHTYDDLYTGLADASTFQSDAMDIAPAIQQCFDDTEYGWSDVTFISISVFASDVVIDDDDELWIDGISLYDYVPVAPNIIPPASMNICTTGSYPNGQFSATSGYDSYEWSVTGGDYSFYYGNYQIQSPTIYFEEENEYGTDYEVKVKGKMGDDWSELTVYELDNVVIGSASAPSWGSSMSSTWDNDNSAYAASVDNPVSGIDYELIISVYGSNVTSQQTITEVSSGEWNIEFASVSGLYPYQLEVRAKNCTDVLSNPDYHYVTCID